MLAEKEKNKQNARRVPRGRDQEAWCSPIMDKTHGGRKPGGVDFTLTQGASPLLQLPSYKQLEQLQLMMRQAWRIYVLHQGWLISRLYKALLETYAEVLWSEVT